MDVLQESKRMIVGLTGGIGSGKSTVAQCFRELGVTVLDSDQITRQMVEPNSEALKEIVQRFGEKILNNDKTLNRTLLRNIIFESAEERQWLENLLHPSVKEHILEYAKKTPKGQYLLVEIPLLFEANFQDAVDRILVVDCPENFQIERVSLRDAIPKGSVDNILNTQVSRSERLAKANDVIDNAGEKESLKKKAETLHLYYLELSK